jgi:hypothetical protein
VKDLDSVWAEYYDGLCGKPSLKRLEEDYGAEWKPWVAKNADKRMEPGAQKAGTLKAQFHKVEKIVQRVGLYARALSENRGVERDEGIDREAFQILKKQKASIMVKKDGIMDEICLRDFLAKHITIGETNRLALEETRMELLNLLSTHASI